MKNRKEKLGAWILFFVGIHSIMLGFIIYFFTDFFYQIFFSATVENIFFVRQSGVFLFLAGFFYLYPLIDLQKLYNMILLVIFSKFIAVYFLVANAKFTLSPDMIYLAALFDGLMGFFLIFIYLNFRKNCNRAKTKVVPEGQYAMTDK
ncbi:hypothetical protein ACFLZ5_06270 [Thermodesulfobacteriota bacterium]